jgi:hypothetical protein
MLGFVIASVALARLEATASGTQMSQQAVAFLASLNDEQRAKAALGLDAPQRTDWHFIPKATRKGLQVREMSQEQRKKAHGLLAASLSKVGYGKAVKIMDLENLLKELEKGKTGTPLRDPERYYFTVFGKPAADGKWGLSVEGHHLSLNFVVDKGNITSFAPLALCANPATVMSDSVPSIKKGLRVLASEEELAFNLLGSLSADQKKKAIIAEKALAEVRAAGEPQPPQAAAEGIAGKDLDEKQRGQLKSLVQAYLANVPDDVAEQRLKTIDAGWDSVHFAWAGSEKPGVGHYYKVQGEAFLIEFVNTQPDAAGNIANHIHAVWRSLEGDFGIPAKK